MTKMKSKKMTKSTFAIIIMAIAIVALLAFGGSYAYFTATTATKTSTAETGTIRLQLGSVTTVEDAKVVYNEEVLGAITLDASETTVASYAFVTFESVITPNEDDTDSSVTFADIFGADIAVKTGWNKLQDTTNGAVYYYVIAEGASDLSLEFIDSLTVTASPNWAEGTDTMPETMGVGISVTVSGCAIQQSGFKTAENTDAAAAALAYVEAVKETTHTNK